MSHFIRARVTSKSDNQLSLELPNSETLQWDIENSEDSHLDMNNIAIGDELTLTLTTTHNIINELLSQ